MAACMARVQTPVNILTVKAVVNYTPLPRVGGPDPTIGNWQTNSISSFEFVLVSVHTGLYRNTNYKLTKRNISEIVVFVLVIGGYIACY